MCRETDINEIKKDTLYFKDTLLSTPIYFHIGLNHMKNVIFMFYWPKSKKKTTIIITIIILIHYSFEIVLQLHLAIGDSNFWMRVRRD